MNYKAVEFDGIVREKGLPHSKGQSLYRIDGGFLVGGGRPSQDHYVQGRYQGFSCKSYSPIIGVWVENEEGKMYRYGEYNWGTAMGTGWKINDIAIHTKRDGGELLVVAIRNDIGCEGGLAIFSVQDVNYYPLQMEVKVLSNSYPECLFIEGCHVFLKELNAPYAEKYDIGRFPRYEGSVWCRKNANGVYV